MGSRQWHAFIWKCDGYDIHRKCVNYVRVLQIFFASFFLFLWMCLAVCLHMREKSVKWNKNNVQYMKVQLTIKMHCMWYYTFMWWWVIVMHRMDVCGIEETSGLKQHFLPLFGDFVALTIGFRRIPIMFNRIWKSWNSNKLGLRI